MINIKTKILDRVTFLSLQIKALKTVKDYRCKKIALHDFSRCDLQQGNLVHLRNLFLRPKKVRGQADQKGSRFFLLLLRNLCDTKMQS